MSRIGFRAAWANNTSAQLTAGYLMTPWHKGSSTVIKGYGYPITIHAAIQLIVTGPVGNGTMIPANWFLTGSMTIVLLESFVFSSVGQYSTGHMRPYRKKYYRSTQ